MTASRTTMNISDIFITKLISAKVTGREFMDIRSTGHLFQGYLQANDSKDTVYHLLHPFSVHSYSTVNLSS
ncbi:unnamed protein product [Schistosoma turkestanicum]|nr:unnamed protein product [Schistosoma turkestanicum]